LTPAAPNPDVLFALFLYAFPTFFLLLLRNRAGRLRTKFCNMTYCEAAFFASAGVAVLVKYN
jgi:hypothetical protein